MKDIYIFNVLTGLRHKATQSMTILHDMGWPLDVLVKSKSYDKMDDCIKDAVEFVNSQIEQIADNYQTLIECNPFLTGITSDQSDEEEMARWTSGEMMKIHASNTTLGDDSDLHPLTCSILKVTTFSGFEIDGNETVN